MNYVDDSKKKGRHSWHTIPIIVPPIFEKGSFIGKALAKVWNSAFDSLVTADHIIVYGYSFPQSDQQSSTFFRRAMSKRDIKKGLLLSVINTDVIAIQRAQEVLSPEATSTSKSVDSYIDHLIPLLCGVSCGGIY